MQYLVIGRDGTDEGAEQRRMAVRSAHVELGDEFVASGRMLYGVALLDTAGRMIGSALVVDFPSRSELDRWLAREPYVTGGVWREIDIQLSLGGAGVAGLLWMLTKGPLLSVILVTIIDAFGSFPTFRKSFRNPYEESSVAYIGGAVAFSLALLALQAYRAETVLFPSFIVLADGSLVIMLMVRRWRLATSSR